MGVELTDEMKIIAINECIMEDTNEPSLTIGKEYEIYFSDGYEFSVIDDEGDEHYFNQDGFEEYFKVPVYDQYIEAAIRTESGLFNIEKGDDRLLHAGIGLATESAEFLDALKKHVFYGKELDKVNLKEEIGDLMWYCAIALDQLDGTFDEVQNTNIKKLKARYPEKFTEKHAEVRNLEAERKILEES